MRKLTLVVHTSLDGFVAGVNGELDGFQPGDENLAFVCSLTEQADAALFGRISYELLNAHWPGAKDNPGATQAEINYSNWFNKAQKFVVSGTASITGMEATVQISENIAGNIQKIKNQPGKDILIFGSPTLSHELLQHNLIDSIWIFINPVIFGQGIPLFRQVDKKINLVLLETRQFANGELAVNYVKA